MSKKFITTELEPDQYLLKETDSFQIVKPYANSNGKSEGLTISLKELRKFAKETDKLEVGTRFKMAVVVDGKNELPLIQGHINQRGGYITGPVATYHEKMGTLPEKRIAMGDKRKGIDYNIKVSSILWFFKESVEEAPLEMQSEAQSENGLSIDVICNDLDHNSTNVTENYSELVQQKIEEPTEVILIETQSEEQN